METFGKTLKKYRTAIGISQNGLAKAVNIDPSYINRLEKDFRQPSKELVYSIASFLKLDKVETDELLLAADYAPRYFARELVLNEKMRLMADLISDIETQDTIERMIDDLIEKGRY